MTDLNATWNEATRGPRMSEATGKVIFKYQMPVREQFTMELPVGAQIIRVQDMDGFFWMWAVVNTDMPTEKRHFRSFKTGAKIPDDFDTSYYIGFCAVFVQMELGLYIFEEKMPVEVVVDTSQHLTKSDVVRAMGELRGIPVVDLKLSQLEPSDLAGIPTFHVNKENAAKWFKDATAWMYEDPKTRHIADIDAVLTGFEDVLRPVYNEQLRRNWQAQECATKAWLREFCARLDQQKAGRKISQKRIDEIEAQGGFEEEEV